MATASTVPLYWLPAPRSATPIVRIVAPLVSSPVSAKRVVVPPSGCWKSRSPVPAVALVKAAGPLMGVTTAEANPEFAGGGGGPPLQAPPARPGGPPPPPRPPNIQDNNNTQPRSPLIFRPPFPP